MNTLPKIYREATEGIGGSVVQPEDKKLKYFIEDVDTHLWYRNTLLDDHPTVHTYGKGWDHPDLPDEYHLHRPYHNTSLPKEESAFIAGYNFCLSYKGEVDDEEELRKKLESAIALLKEVSRYLTPKQYLTKDLIHSFLRKNGYEQTY